MSFLDNLENSLKSLENSTEQNAEAAEKRQVERQRSLAEAPWAEKLKNSEYVKTLMDRAVVMGHERRTKVYMAWLGTAFRLEAKGQSLQLRPASDGIKAEWTGSDGTSHLETIDLAGNPNNLLTVWFTNLLMKANETE